MRVRHVKPAATLAFPFRNQYGVPPRGDAGMAANKTGKPIGHAAHECSAHTCPHLYTWPRRTPSLDPHRCPHHAAQGSCSSRVRSGHHRRAPHRPASLRVPLHLRPRRLPFLLDARRQLWHPARVLKPIGVHYAPAGMILGRSSGESRLSRRLQHRGALFLARQYMRSATRTLFRWIRYGHQTPVSTSWGQHARALKSSPAIKAIPGAPNLLCGCRALTPSIALGRCLGGVHLPDR